MSATLYPAVTSFGTVTSFIPLTTTWTASPGCESKYRLDGPSLMAFDPGYGLDVETDVICDPPAMTTWWEQGLLGGGGSYVTAVSIGPLVCPSGWTTVGESTKDSSSTAAMCCPPGYYLEGGAPGQVTGNCLSDVSSGMTLTYGSTSYGDSSSWSMATTTMESSSTVGAIGIVGWNIKLATTPTSTPMTTSLTSTSTTSTTPQTATSTNSPSNSGTNSGLSSGAKAGIGVGVAVGFIGVLALIVAIFLLRRRKDKEGDGKAPPTNAPAPDQPPYQPGPTMAGPGPGPSTYAPTTVGGPFYDPSSSGQHSYNDSSSGRPAPTDQISYHNPSISNTAMSSFQRSQDVSNSGMSEAGWQERQNWPVELDGNRHPNSPVELS